MKAVFPAKGIVILTKYSVKAMNDFYMDKLVNSKMFSIYKQSNYPIQSGNLNYLPQKSNIVLNNAHLLTAKKLQELILSQEQAKKPQKAETTKPSEELLDDNFILSNPFFKTLTSVD